jgi:hypothetical protein
MVGKKTHGLASWLVGYSFPRSAARWRDLRRGASRTAFPRGRTRDFLAAL